jgi:hypothetical protein
MNQLPEILQYVRSLETALQRQKDEYNYLFNTPLLRFVRGIKNLKHDPALGLRDLRMAFRHLVRGRTQKYNEPVFRKFSVCSLKRSEPTWHPYALLRDSGHQASQLRIGEPLTGTSGKQTALTPQNFEEHLFHHPVGSVAVYVNTRLLDTPWGDLFSVDEMQNFKRFCWLKERVEADGGSVHIITEEPMDMTLIAYLRN